MTQLPRKGEPGYPSPHRVRELASKDLTLEMIGVHFDLTEDEFTRLLKKDPLLKRAYDFGCIDAKVSVKKEIWDSKSPMMTLLRARCVLKMDNPIVDALAGDALKFLIMKMEASERKSLGQVLGFSK